MAPMYFGRRLANANALIGASSFSHHQRPALIYSVGALLLGGQLLSIGFLAELITAFLGRDADTYSIAERTPSHESPAHADAHESTH